MTSEAPMQYEEGSLGLNSLIRDWGAVMALRRSAQQFNGRLMRTAPMVAELAASYPGLRDAVKWSAC